KKEIDLRSRLFTLDVVNPLTLTELPSTVCDRLAATGDCVIRYAGSCRNDGTLLRPQGVLAMLESISGKTLVLGHIHRAQLILADVSEE
ncbi:MAG: hypothetical protein WA984_09100, partial [Phormidesmis sp.]